MNPVIKETPQQMIPKNLIEKVTIIPGVQINIYAYEDQHKEERRL